MWLYRQDDNGVADSQLVQNSPKTNFSGRAETSTLTVIVSLDISRTPEISVKEDCDFGQR